MEETIIKKKNSFWLSTKNFITCNSKWSNLFYFLLLLTICLGIFLGIEISTACYGGFFHMNSDDIIQYYPYVAGFFNKIKSGSLSLYDSNLYLGVSGYSALYYVPLDIFTFIAFILSFIFRAEAVYAAMNLLKPIGGALLLFYFFKRKGFYPIASFLVSIIFLVGGMTEAYYIFPVYLGINFYVPLGMILVDLFIEKKKWLVFVLPLYSFQVIFYDFYMAYMILAFICFYFLIEMHIRGKLKIFGKNQTFFKKDFWISFISFMALIILGVLMASVILFPAMLYILHGSARSNEALDNLWVFQKNGKTYWAHYFLQFVNMFIPNEPHAFCLTPAGAYIREHASLYITTGGLVFFIYFFFLTDKEANRLKPWVLLFNLLYLIPVVCMFFSVASKPYVRWFFMPFTLNVYAMAMAMNKTKLAFNKKYFLIAPIIMLILGLTSLILIMTNTTFTEMFIHYEKNSEKWYMIVIPSLCIISVLIILLVHIIIGEIITSYFPKAQKTFRLAYKITIFVLIIGEVGYSTAVIMTNVGNTSKSYYNNTNDMYKQKNNLYSIGFNDNSGYRINMYTNTAKAVANANELVGGVNYGRFFQSFYSDNVNVCLSKFYYESDSDWSRTFTSGYSLLASPVFNVKYVTAWTDKNMSLPTKYYSLEKTDSNINYFVNNSLEAPFIVYDSVINDSNYYYNLAESEIALLQYAYVEMFNDDIDTTEDNYTSDYQKILDNKIKIANRNEARLSLPTIYRYSSSTYTTDDTDEKLKGYRIYDLTNESVIKNSDVLIVKPCLDIRRQSYDDIKILDSEGNLHKAHYDTIYLNDIDNDGNITKNYTASKLLIKSSKDTYSNYIDVYGYNYDIYEKYLESQKVYTNKEFSLNGTSMSIKLTLPDNTVSRIIKTGYSYSDEWKVKTKGYETIEVDGGFLGVIIPEETDLDINIKLEFEPEGYNISLKASIIGVILYLIVVGAFAFIFIRQRRKAHEENINNSTML